MTETNVIVLNSSEVVSTLTFEHTSSLVSFIANYADDHNDWNVSFELVLVHRSGKVLRFRAMALRDLITLAYGIQIAGWLSADEGEIPTMNYVDWLKEDNVAKVFPPNQDVEVGYNEDRDEEDGFDEDPYA